MKNITFFLVGDTPALSCAGMSLSRKGYHVIRDPKNATHLLLPVPSFDENGSIKGELRNLEEVLQQFPAKPTIMGGNLTLPILSNYRCLDFLTDPMYLAENASITAHCTLRVLLEHLNATLPGMHILVIGWGRIGKCLGKLLKDVGAHVTVTSRKAEDRSMLVALGYDALDPQSLNINLSRYQLVINTAPFPVLDEERCRFLRTNCLKIDLASKQGILAPDVIWARGLPGKYAPETSGDLIARTAIRLAHE